MIGRPHTHDTGFFLETSQLDEPTGTSQLDELTGLTATTTTTNYNDEIRGRTDRQAMIQREKTSRRWEIDLPRFFGAGKWGLTCVCGRKEKTVLPDWSFLELCGRTRSVIGQQVHGRWGGLEDGGAWGELSSEVPDCGWLFYALLCLADWREGDERAPL